MFLKIDLKKGKYGGEVIFGGDRNVIDSDSIIFNSFSLVDEFRFIRLLF